MFPNLQTLGNTKYSVSSSKQCGFLYQNLIHIFMCIFFFLSGCSNNLKITEHINKENYNKRRKRSGYLIRYVTTWCCWLSERCIRDRTRCRQNTYFVLALLYEHHYLLANILHGSMYHVKRTRKQLDLHTETIPHLDLTLKDSTLRNVFENINIKKLLSWHFKKKIIQQCESIAYARCLNSHPSNRSQLQTGKSKGKIKPTGGTITNILIELSTMATMDSKYAIFL